MAILAIDTSSKACVLGIRDGAETWVDEAVLGRTHSQEILPRIEALLRHSEVKKEDIELIVYGQGPGSFTGLRIGIGVVQGLAYGLDVPVVAVSSLACLAQQVCSNTNDSIQHVMVALSARNSEVYFGAFEAVDNGVKLIGREGVFEAAEIPSQDASKVWRGVGDGWQLTDALEAGSGVTVNKIDLDLLPRAEDLLNLGLLARDAGLERASFEAMPEYLREQVATPGGSGSK